MLMLRCYYCTEEFDDLQQCAKHCQLYHGDFEFKYRKRVLNEISGKFMLQSVHHPTIVPNKIAKEGKRLKVEGDILYIERGTGKRQKLDPGLPSKKSEKDDFVQSICTILPSLYDNLFEENQVDTIKNFLHLVSNGRFPLKNIAYALFLDVVNWYSQNITTHMRYQEATMNFWKVGYRLFHGKFLRFMSGQKNIGHLIDHPEDKGCIDPFSSAINFAVPSRHNLYRGDELSTSNAFLPGIFHQAISSISNSSVNKVIKLAVDGKKISRGKGTVMGDIDCWGHEGEPSLQQKKEDFERQLAFLSRILETLGKADPNTIGQTNHESNDILSSLQTVVKYIAIRQNNLRAVTQALTGTEAKILKMAGEDWRKSKFFPLIASLRVNKMDVNQHIKEGLQLSKSISLLGSEMNGKSHLTTNLSEVLLADQGNYVPLLNSGHENEDATREIKQGSQTWHRLRQKAKVTGSTCNRAVGLGKFKEQIAHYDKVILDKPEEPFAEAVKQLLQYGKDHEIDAIATLCSTILPFYFPHLLYFEEGCMTLAHGDQRNFMVVSPDGSLRSSCESSPELMFETKCKSPTGYVQHSYYSIPKYYVPQILAEMAAYSCEKLIFTCWSQESTTLFLVTFDEEIWGIIWNELISLYSSRNTTRPKKSSPNLPNLREKIDHFLTKNTELLAEFPSSIRIESHGNEVADARYIDKVSSMNSQQRKINLVERIGEAVNSCKKWFSSAYHLSRTVATEILVYMVSDLDRRFQMEMNNSHIIAYAMKGSSMRADSFRKMMNDVISSCETAGLKVLVTASDGQWHRYSIRDDEDRPLTIHQLHRDHWNDTKKKPLSALRTELFNLCRVKPDELVMTREIGKGIVVENVISVNHFKEFTIENFLLSRFPLHSDARMGNYDIGSKNVCGPGVQSVITEATDEPNAQETTQLECGLDFLCPSDDLGPVTGSSSNRGAYYSDVPTRDLQRNNVDVCIEQDSPIDLVSEALEVLYRQDDNLYEQMVDTRHSIPPETETEVCMFLGSDQDIRPPQSEDKTTFINHGDRPRRLERMKSDLRSSISHKHNHWSNMPIQDFAKCFENHAKMEKSFTKNEICVCLSSLKDEDTSLNVTWRKSWKKGQLIDALWNAFNDIPCLHISRKKMNPPTLRKLCKNAFEKLNKTELAIILASLSWQEKLQNWMFTGIYPTGISIEGLTDSIHWFSQPNAAGQEVRFHFTDACHILTCLRTKLCTSGIEGLSKNAWKEAALSPTTSLNIALVTDCLDKQSVSMARRVFALDVQQHMEQAGKFPKEAHFCKLVREWFDSVDEPKLSSIDRVRKRLALRDWLLNGYHIGQFPPHTQYVRGIPIVTFEALVIHIERSIQMYPFLQNSYNVRTLGTQEVEQFFSTFRDMDPSGSGTPKPDAIPGMMRSTVELDNFRLDPDRGFHMKTTKASIYPSVNLSKITDDDRSASESNNHIGMLHGLKTITPRNHEFDEKTNGRATMRRKSGKISLPDKPALGEHGVRQYHRKDDSKILAFKRRGLSDIPS